jgi:hypothetical protein
MGLSTKLVVLTALASVAACAGTRGASTPAQTSSAQVTASGSPELRTVDNSGFVDPGGGTRQVNQGGGPAPVGRGAEVPPPNRERISGGPSGSEGARPGPPAPAATRPAPIDATTLAERAAQALCDRETSCDRVGPGKPYESVDACTSSERGRAREILGSRPCREIAGDHAARCLSAIRARSCSAATAIVGALPECSPETLCPAT